MTARVAELQSYEVPADFLIETEPFSAANGLLSGVGKILRPRLKEHYGEQLEQLYADLADGPCRRAACAARGRHRPDRCSTTSLGPHSAVLGSTDVEIDPMTTSPTSAATRCRR